MSDMRRLTLWIGTAACILIASAPATARAHDGPAGPDGLPPARPKHPWRLFSGVPRVDTLSYPQRDVIRAACRQFQRDKWQIYSVDATRGEIVTKWKALHHPFLAIFVGSVRARCTVVIEPLGPDRSRMVFRGDLVSHRDLSKSHMMGASRRAYANAARDYETEVRQYLHRGGHQRGVQISSAEDWEAEP